MKGNRFFPFEKTKKIYMFKVVHLRRGLENAVSSSRDRTFPLDATLAMIQTLIDCDEFQDIATLRVRLALSFSPQ